MKNILITGAAGFIGFSLSCLLQKNYNLTLIDNFSNYYDVNLKKKRADILKKNGNKVLKVDICDKNKLKKVLNSKKFFAVIHLAAQAGVRYSIEEPDSYIENNIIGSFNLLDCVKNMNIKHILIASSSSVYGSRMNKKRLNENSTSDYPVSLYAATKKSVESIAHSYSHLYNLPITMFRFFTVYGPWGRPDMALFKFANQVSKNKSIDVYNSGNMWRDFTYIDDLCESIKRLINLPPKKIKHKVSSLNRDISSRAPFEIVNIGNQKAISLKDLIRALEKSFGKKFKKKNLPIQLGDVPFTLSDSTLLKKLTGFSPNTDIQDGVNKFYEWYIKNYE